MMNHTANHDHQAAILLAENHPDSEQPARVLQSLGYRVDRAGTGREVLEAVEHNHYQFVCLDCRLPVIDGLTATRCIRSREQHAGNRHHLPVIAMTSKKAKANFNACLQAGVDAVIEKPFGLKELRRALQEHV